MQDYIHIVSEKLNPTRALGDNEKIFQKSYLSNYLNRNSHCTIEHLRLGIPKN